jgi:hypothetical protein
MFNVMKKIKQLFCLALVFSSLGVYAQTMDIPVSIATDNADHGNLQSVTVISAEPAAAAITSQYLPAVKLSMVSCPNPFTNRTSITCYLPVKGKLTLEIRNMFGETVNTIEDNVEKEGTCSLEVTSEHLRPGIYTALLMLKTSDNVMTKSIRIVCNQ